MVCNTIDARRAKVALEGDNCLSRRLVEVLGAVYLIAVAGKRLLDLRDL